MARTLRIVTGLILFAFVTGHLLNQAIGLHSLAKMDEWRGIIMAPWTNSVGSAILMISMISHGLLGMVSLYRRNTLNMSASDAVQFITGFMILPLLVPHVIAIKMGVDLIPGYQPSYQGILQYFWVQNPLEGLRQIFVLVIVWIHGAIGLLTWFRLQSWWSIYGRFINPLMVLVPVSALLGFVEGGKEVIIASALRVPLAPSPQIIEALETIATAKWNIIYIYSALLAGVLLFRQIRLRKHTSRTIVQYLHGPQISSKTGLSLLELSIANDVPHANLCRGRGRCGTCQVRVVSSQHDIPQPSDLEQATLNRIQAAPDIRLACQLIPSEGNLVVERMVAPYIAPKDLKSSLKDIESSALAEMSAKSEAGA